MHAHIGVAAAIRPKSRGYPLALGFRDTPNVVETVTGLVPGFLVLDPEIQWFAFVCPLLLAIIADHDVV